MTELPPGQSGHLYSNRAVLAVFAIYFICIALAAFHSYKKPEYNWDMLAYMALVVKMEHSDIDEIHTITYKSAKDNIPAEFYHTLTDSSNKYRKRMSESAAGFYQQLPFYLIKPLYIGAVCLFYKAGFSLPASTVLPSVFAYLLTGVLLFYWLKRYVPVFYCAVTSLLVMLSAPMLTVARMSSPDFLSALFLFSALYFIIEKPAMVPMFIFLVASIFTRLDNIIIAAAIISLLAFTNKWIRKISFVQYASMLLLLIICYFCVTVRAGSYGWGLLYYPSFSHYLNISHDFHAVFSWKDYLKIISADAITGLYHSHIAVFLVMLLFLFCKGRPARFTDLDFDQLFSIVIVLVILTRFLLGPDISDRFYIPYYLMIVVFFIRMITGRPKIYYQPGNMP